MAPLCAAGPNSLSATFPGGFREGQELPIVFGARGCTTAKWNLPRPGPAGSSLLGIPRACYNDAGIAAAEGQANTTAPRFIQFPRSLSQEQNRPGRAKAVRTAAHEEQAWLDLPEWISSSLIRC